MLTQISSMDKVSIVALAKSIEKEHGTTTISSLAAVLGVPLMSESRNRKGLVDRILRPKAPTSERPGDSPLVETARLLVAALLERSGALGPGEERRSYAPWFKELVGVLRDQGATLNAISSLTGISCDTLTKFARSRGELCKGKISETHERVAEIWKDASPRHRQTLDSFWGFLGKKHSSLTVSFKEVRQILIDLGLRYPRGPKIANHGTQVKKPFAPHALWEGDGKEVKIVINGIMHKHLWYAFVDQQTTLLVGASISGVESSEAFLEALRDGKIETGLFPIGILIDNRLSGCEMGPIHDFCQEHGIILVRTFPGNSKSNGNIENNFSLFERHVGTLKIHGNTTEEISRSIAENLVEVFTELRNHKPRARLEDQTPKDAATCARRPEHVRTAIEKMAERFKVDDLDVEEKWELISLARPHFGDLSDESKAKLKFLISRYPTSDLIAAQAAYLAQIEKQPLSQYGSEYFLAILRHKRESLAKKAYNEAFRAGLELSTNLASTLQPHPAHAGRMITAELEKLAEEPSSSHQFLRLDALAWALVSNFAPKSLKSLWREVGDLSERSNRISLRLWQVINEYLAKRIGSLLFDFPSSDGMTAAEQKIRTCQSHLATHNLS